MAGLLLKDVLGLKKYMKQLGVSLIMFFIIAVSFKSPNYLIGMAVLMSSMTLLTAMTYDETAKWDKYALSMPLSKRDLVASKYLLLLGITFGSGLISAVLSLIMALYFKQDKPLEVFVIAGGVCLIALVFCSFMLPIAFKLGVEKSRIFIAVIIGIPTFLLVAYSNLGLDLGIPIPTEQQVKLAIYASPFIAFGILYLSFHLSVSILLKKEF
jgi:hypothetical protein